MRTIGGGIYAFDKDGIVVSLPSDRSYIIPRRLEPDWLPEMWQQTNFRPLRLVMNLKLVDLTDPDAYQFTFDSPVQIQVYYGLAEKIQVMNNEFKLAYWQNKQWNLIKDYVDVYPILSRGWAGFLRFEVGSWGDPTIALGF